MCKSVFKIRLQGLVSISMYGCCCAYKRVKVWYRVSENRKGKRVVYLFDALAKSRWVSVLRIANTVAGETRSRFTTLVSCANRRQLQLISFLVDVTLSQSRQFRICACWQLIFLFILMSDNSKKRRNYFFLSYF